MRRFKMHSVLTIILAVLLIAGATRSQNRDPAKTPVVYSVPGMSQAVVRSGVVFDNSSATPLALDAYLPRGLRKGERRSTIVFISGGERVRHWQWYITWGQLAAAHGMIGIVPDKRYPRGFDGTRAGFEDTEKLLAFLADNADTLGVDPQRICLWTFSAGGRLTSVGLQPRKSNGPGATKQAGMPALPGAVRCLVSFYGVLDMSGEFSGVSNEADREALLKRYSPVQALESLVASGGKSPPVFIARAGKDSAFINNGIDRFTAAALRLNVPITVVNYADGDHGFDGFNDTAQSRAIIAAALRFAQSKPLCGDALCYRRSISSCGPCQEPGTRRVMSDKLQFVAGVWKFEPRKWAAARSPGQVCAALGIACGYASEPTQCATEHADCARRFCRPLRGLGSERADFPWAAPTCPGLHAAAHCVGYVMPTSGW